MQVQEGDQPPHPPHLSGQGVFLWLWPLFARAPRHWFLENFLLSAPGVQSVFFFVALRWAPRPFGGARAKKKNTTQGFFLLRPRRKAREGEAPLEAGTGPEQKKITTQGVFLFCCGPARTGVVFFFAVAPPGRSLTHGGLGRFRQGPGGVFFCCGPAGSF